MPRRSRFDPGKLDRLDEMVELVLEGDEARMKVADPSLGWLADMAAGLRQLPREGFRARLQSELERSSSMRATAEPMAAPHTVAAPRLTFKHAAKAIEFYQQALGAREVMRFETAEGIGHAEIMIGDSVIMLAEEWPEGGRYSSETLGNSPVTMALQVADVDAFLERAIAAGAQLVYPIADQFYGHRKGSVLDPFGYVWDISTRQQEMSVEEMHGRYRSMKEQEGKKAGVRPVPPGYRTLTPYLVAPDALGLIDFLKPTFDVRETFRTVGSAGGVHCELRLGDSMLMTGSGGPGLNWSGQPRTMACHVYVPDCDATYRRALEAGGESLDPPKDQFYGERSASVKDPAGNHWYIATCRGENYKWEGAPDLQPYLHPLRAEPVISFLKRAFRGVELARHATPDGVIHHATLKIGDSHLEMGEAHGRYQPMQSMFNLYVPDCDAVYQRALAAGAKSIAEPKDQPYGDRSGAVEDVFGNQWCIATHIKD
jgi:PhnB protein